MDSEELKIEHKQYLTEIIENFGEDLEKLKVRFLSDIGQSEVMDRTYIVCENFQSYILSHPYVILDVTLFEKAINISEQLFELYQEIGREDYAKD